MRRVAVLILLTLALPALATTPSQYPGVGVGQGGDFGLAALVADDRLFVAWDDGGPGPLGSPTVVHQASATSACDSGTSNAANGNDAYIDLPGEGYSTDAVACVSVDGGVLGNSAVADITGAVPTMRPPAGLVQSLHSIDGGGEWHFAVHVPDVGYDGGTDLHADGWIVGGVGIVVAPTTGTLAWADSEAQGWLMSAWEGHDVGTFVLTDASWPVEISQAMGDGTGYWATYLEYYEDGALAGTAVSNAVPFTYPFTADPTPAPTNFQVHDAPEGLVLTWERGANSANIEGVHIKRDGNTLIDSPTSKHTYWVDSTIIGGSNHCYEVQFQDRNFNKGPFTAQVCQDAFAKDQDGDGAPDYLEDTDQDGVAEPTDASDYTDPDTDGDGLLDGIEMGLGGDTDPATTTDPRNPDSDTDGLTDSEEDADLDGAIDALETDPNNSDTDGDLLTDAEELLGGHRVITSWDIGATSGSTISAYAASGDSLLVATSDESLYAITTTQQLVEITNQIGSGLSRISPFLDSPNEYLVMQGNWIYRVSVDDQGASASQIFQAPAFVAQGNDPWAMANVDGFFYAEGHVSGGRGMVWMDWSLNVLGTCEYYNPPENSYFSTLGFDGQGVPLFIATSSDWAGSRPFSMTGCTHLVGQASSHNADLIEHPVYPGQPDFLLVDWLLAPYHVNPDLGRFWDNRATQADLGLSNIYIGARGSDPGLWYGVETGTHVIDAIRIITPSDPLLADTDGDGWSDREESLLASTHPHSATNFPDLATDSDGDGLYDHEEVLTDPFDADSDDDGINDGDETNGQAKVVQTHDLGSTGPMYLFSNGASVIAKRGFGEWWFVDTDGDLHDGDADVGSAWMVAPVKGAPEEYLIIGSNAGPDNAKRVKVTASGMTVLDTLSAPDAWPMFDGSRYGLYMPDYRMDVVAHVEHGFVYEAWAGSGDNMIRVRDWGDQQTFQCSKSGNTPFLNGFNDEGHPQTASRKNLAGGVYPDWNRGDLAGNCGTFQVDSGTFAVPSPASAPSRQSKFGDMYGDTTRTLLADHLSVGWSIYTGLGTVGHGFEREGAPAYYFESPHPNAGPDARGQDAAYGWYDTDGGQFIHRAYAHGTSDPLDADSDDDGWTDYQESRIYGTPPMSAHYFPGLGEELEIDPETFTCAGAAAGSVLGGWNASPGDADVDALTWLKVTTGVSTQFAFDFTDPSFTNGEWIIPVNDNIQFLYGTGLTPPCGSATVSPVDSDGAIVLDVEPGLPLYISYRLVQLPSVLGHGSYSASFTATEV